VNVGRDNSLPMDRLRTDLEALGCTGVQTYLQSGNAVFETTRTARALAGQLGPRLEAFMGRPIELTLRTRAEFAAVVAGNPFTARANEPKRLCVTFLQQPPTKAQLTPLTSKDFGDEAFHLNGRELYTWHPQGQGRSPLATALTKLRVTGALTTRNWNTVLALDALLRA
jgi:uncharacterized protein (DUF1697 family)